MISRFSVVAFICALISLFTACVTTPSHFYTLNATPGAEGAPSDLSVVVGPVSVPPLVDRPQIVISTGPNQVRMDEFNRWAMPLQNDIARVVADDLSAMLGTRRVTLYPQKLGMEPDYRVAIEVQSFESMPGEEAVLDAVWTVRRTKDNVAETGRSTVSETVQGNGYDALAAAHSRAVDRMSRDIASALTRLSHAGQ
jgi:uncharacterized lipoprotein YmbA